MMLTITLTFFVVIMCIITVPIIAFYMYCHYKLMEKCGNEGWKGIIPYYNIWNYIQIAGLNWWYILLIVGASVLLIDAGVGLTILCNIILVFVSSLLNYNLCKRINNGRNQLILDTLLLTIVPIVFLPLMALNKEYTYKPEVKTTPNAYIDEIQSGEYKSTYNKEKVSKKAKFCDSCGEPLTNKTKFCPNCGKKI